MRDAIKKGGRELHETLKHGKLVIDRNKHQATSTQVKLTIEREMDQVLPQVHVTTSPPD
jgi:hypothetical protein